MGVSLGYEIRIYLKIRIKTYTPRLHQQCCRKHSREANTADSGLPDVFRTEGMMELPSAEKETLRESRAGPPGPVTFKHSFGACYLSSVDTMQSCVWSSWGDIPVNSSGPGGCPGPPWEAGKVTMGPGFLLLFSFSLISSAWETLI